MINNNQQQQQQSKQPIFCQWCHNVEITFSEHFKSKTGKFIPIEKSSGVPHNCPQNPNRQQQIKSAQTQASEVKPVQTSEREVQPTQTQEQRVEPQATPSIHDKLTDIITRLQGLETKIDLLTKLVYSQTQPDNFSKDKNLSLDNR